MNIFGLHIYKEKAGVISEDPCWCCFRDCYFYTGDTLFQLLRCIVKYWKDDRMMI